MRFTFAGLQCSIIWKTQIVNYSKLTQAFVLLEKDLTMNLALPLAIGVVEHFMAIKNSKVWNDFEWDSHRSIWHRFLAIIQLMAASEAGRPLIYATYRDGNLVDSFSLILDYLRDQNATVGDLYRYLQRFCNGSNHRSFFQFILNIPVSSLKWEFFVKIAIFDKTK